LANTVSLTNSCSNIDHAFGSLNYQSSQFSIRNISFLYGAAGGLSNTLYCGTSCTIEIRAKFAGGANTGSHPTFFMFQGTCLNSFPNGTDNGCTFGEIDIAEFGLTSVFTSVNQQIHVTGPHNDGCTATGITDPSANFHTYDLVWSSGQLVWKIDGSTTCTVTQAYVPSTAMMIEYQTWMNGANSGAINGLPWQTQIDYIKVTNGAGAVIFNDDFMNVASVGP
jgi:beta-glucanase (GH16 family)